MSKSFLFKVFDIFKRNSDKLASVVFFKEIIVDNLTWLLLCDFFYSLSDVTTDNNIKELKYW